MSAWTLAALGLLPALLLAVVTAGRGGAAGRLTAVQLAASLATFVAIILTFVDDHSSSIDLALALALLTLPATLSFALFEERWL